MVIRKDSSAVCTRYARFQGHHNWPPCSIGRAEEISYGFFNMVFLRHT